MQGWAIIFLLTSVAACIVAFTGIVIVVTFYAKIFLFISFVCFLIFLTLLFFTKAKKD